ncbi:MAG: cation-translocating P-type ATPase [Halieaceae bacterium]|jgi:P-type Cu2+ transporter|nr:cation-translocating P-type ATPase [Halieaceae bacterium]
MECQLCGLSTPVKPVVGDGHAFCCYGCREVYRCFGDEILTTGLQNRSSSEAEVVQGDEAFLRIDGMHCSSCELLIERSAVRVDGILAVTSSYATSTAKVVYDPQQITEAELPTALSRTGYQAQLRGTALPVYDERQPLLRLIIGVGLAAIVMMLYLAFFYPVHLGLVELDELQPVAWLAFYSVPRVLLLATTILIFYVGAPIFRGAWIGLQVGVLNMDNLLVLAILAAYGYSVTQLMLGSLELYFDVAAMIVAVVTIGRYLEHKARALATAELVTLLDAWTPRARVRVGETFVDYPIEQLKAGDRVTIFQGETIPVDGSVIDGRGAVDESLMTGEPIPVSRETGDLVLGGAVVVEGSLDISVDPQIRSRTDILAKILWNAQCSSAGAKRISDSMAQVFVPLVIVLAVAISGTLSWLGYAPGVALLAGLATMIVSCPCTFGLAIPLATAAGVSAALRRGIIVASADVFEKAGRPDIIAIDKTGILSLGEMTVTEVIGPPQVAEYAAAVERQSEHPIAQAIARLDTRQTGTQWESYPGKGAMATVDNKRIAVGGKALFTLLGWHVEDQLSSPTASASGDSVVSYVGWDGTAHGAIITRDRERPHWEDLLEQLRKMGRVVLLTGAEHPSGYESQVDEVHAGVPPEAKAAVIGQLKTRGRVIMIGDGSNDAPALAAADLGIAFGSPTALAAEAADVVILGDNLDRVFDALRILGTTRRRFFQNLGWALLYNATAIPLAALGMLNPLFAALAMSCSSLLVVWNSSRSLR